MTSEAVIYFINRKTKAIGCSPATIKRSPIENSDKDKVEVTFPLVK